DTAIRYLDRFVMFYIRTADRLTRTSVWLDKMEGGIEHLRNVIVKDSLGIAADLERDMEHLVDTYECEWAGVVNDPVKRARFRHFGNADGGDPTVRWMSERGQIRPAEPEPIASPEPVAKVRRLPIVRREWIRVASASDVVKNGGIAVQYGDVQLAVYNFA